MSKELSIKDLYPFQYYTISNVNLLENNNFKWDNSSFNLTHKHELYIGNINGLVCRNSFGFTSKIKNYLLDRKELRKITFLLPENYRESINNYIGFRQSVLNVLDNPLYREQIVIKTYKVDNSDIIEKIKDMDMVKFDVAIMNPPYDTKTDIHVNIVKSILDKGCNNVVSIMPNDFLKTDEYNKKHARYRHTKIDTMLDYNKELSIEEGNKLFNISYSTNISIMVWNNKGSYDYDSVFIDTSKEKNKKKLIEKQLQSYILNDPIFKLYNKINLTTYNGNGYFIPIGTHGANIATDIGLIYNLEKAYNYKGNEISFDKEKYLNLKTNNNGKGIYVESFERGIELLNIFRSESYMYIQKLAKYSCNENFRHDLNFCPIIKFGDKLLTDETYQKINALLKSDI